MNTKANKTRLMRLHLQQQGVVLFFALIALVAMSLAAVALIRSVDTNSMIAGNLAFKQSAMSSADRGIENAITWLRGRTVVALSAHSAGDGYRADFTGNPIALVDARPGTLDAQGNSISFVIQRMCRTAGNPTPANCLFGPESDSGMASGPTMADEGDPLKSLIYRVTARVVGPKNTVSYIQTFVY